jgi:diacylglycerol kinase (ATP)
VNSAVIIYNPVAGSSQGEAVSVATELRLSLAGWIVERRATEGERGATPIAAEVADWVDYLIVVGGDGSIREAIVGLGDSAKSVNIGLVPVGNANVVARELGIPRESSAAIETLTTGFPVPVDVAFADSELFLAMVGVGWDALVVDYVSRLRRTRIGSFWYKFWADSAYFAAGLLALCKTKPPRFRISKDRMPGEDGYCAAIICNFRTYSKGWSMTPEAHFQSGRVHYQGRFRSLFLFVAWHVIAAVFGRNSPSFISDYGEGDTIHLKGEQPFPVQVDGDFRGYTTDLSITIRPGAARIVVPHPAKGIQRPVWSTTEKRGREAEAGMA